jgi:hypothetical protein
VSAGGMSARAEKNLFKNSDLTRCELLARLLLCSWWGDYSPLSKANQETFMNTRISSKLAALAIALMMNSFIIGGVAYLFDAQVHQPVSVLSFAKQMAAFQWVI